MNFARSIFKSPANCPTWVRLTAEERNTLITNSLKDGSPYEHAVEVVNASEWMGNNHEMLSMQHAMNVARGNMIPFHKFCWLVWLAVGKEAYHAIEN